MKPQQASDKFQLLTDKLLNLMEAGTSPWVKPWHSVPYANALTGHRYQGINPLLASVEVMTYHYSTPLFVGFAQAAEQGWKIRKGSKATPLIWGGAVRKEVTDEATGAVQEKFFRAFRWLNVFNLDCVDDSNASLKVAQVIERYKPNNGNPAPRLDQAEVLIQAQGAKVSFGGDVACYSASLDKIKLPNYEDFSSAEAYYTTFAHELSHWTGHSSRLNRPLQNKFGSQAYAFEELVAELSAAFVCNELAIACQLEHHASYLASWITILKSDNKAFLKAAGLAQKAARYLLQNAGLLAEEDYAAA